MKDTTMLQKVFSNSNDTPCTEASGCKSQKSTSATSDSDKSSKTEKKDEGRAPYPLPTILKHNVKANNHMKLGKRVIPRLSAGSLTDNTKNPSQSDSSEQDNYGQKFIQIVPGPQQRSVDLRQHSMKTISPSLSSTKIRLSVDPSRDSSSPISSKIKTNDKISENCYHTNKASSEKSVSDVFAEYARKNSELKDIVAMIDPTLSSALNSQDCQRPISGQNSGLVKDEPCCYTNFPRTISGSSRHDTSADMEANSQNGLRSNKNIKFDTGSTVSIKMTSAGTNNTPNSTRPSTSWPNMNPNAIIDVKPNVNAIRTVKHQRYVEASSRIQTTNSTLPTTTISATNARPSIRQIQPRSQVITCRHFGDISLVIYLRILFSAAV